MLARPAPRLGAGTPAGARGTSNRGAAVAARRAARPPGSDGGAATGGTAAALLGGGAALLDVRGRRSHWGVPGGRPVAGAIQLGAERGG